MYDKERVVTKQKRYWLLALLALLIATIPALQPLLRADFTCGYDNVFHLWRAVQVEALWAQGVFASRWAPDMAHGYGFPLFVFTSPGPSMVAALLHRSGLVWSLALNATFALGLVLGGLFMLLLGNELFGPAAGFAAAVAYVYAPFQAYDVYNRGSLWEAFAWAFPPLVLWGIQRWSVHKERIAWVAGVLGLALMVMSHHLFAFLFAPLLALWVLVNALARRDWQVLWRGILLGGLGLGLTAFFWVPPLLERGYVQTGRLLGTWVFDYRYNFLSLRHVLALPRVTDPFLVNDWPQKSLGLVPAGLGVLSLLGWHRKTPLQRWHTGLLIGMAVIFTLLTLPVSSAVWDKVPLLSYVQFPWRFLGPAALCTALLVGAGAAAVHQRVGTAWKVPWAPLLMAAVVVAANLGWFFPAHCAPPGDISIRGMLAWERATDTLGTTAKGEYLPIWVEDFPQHPALQDAYASGTIPNRLDATTLPPGSMLYGASYGAVKDCSHLELTQAARLRVLRFYYPGWQVKIDGQDVAIVPEAGSGLITFDVPAGDHVIEVVFRETPQRLAADVVSLVALAGFILVTVRAQTHATGLTSTSQPIVKSYAVSWIAFSMVLLLVKVGYADREGSLWLRTRLRQDGSVRDIERLLSVNFGGKGLLLGMEGLPAAVPGDAAPELTLYWRALQPGDSDWQVGIELVDGVDETAYNIPLRPARWARTPSPFSEWADNQYARMDMVLEIPPGIPPGPYAVKLKLFDRDTLVPASVLGEDGNPLGPDVVIAHINLERPSSPFALESLGIPDNAAPVTCGPLRLWAMTADRTQAAPGDVVVVRSVWEAAHPPDSDVRVPLLLQDARGQVRWEWDVPLVASWWPADMWQVGDRWAGSQALRLPPDLESGPYTLNTGEGCAVPQILKLQVTAPERVWEMPPDYSPVDATFGARVVLKGVLLPEVAVTPGDTLSLSLAWEGRVQIETPYRIFVHLSDEQGHMLAQDDGEPAGWTRPTTGWAVSEVILDDRTLSIPGDALPGSYRLTAGVYESGGGRLTLPDGSDAVHIATIRVE